MVHGSTNNVLIFEDGFDTLLGAAEISNLRQGHDEWLSAHRGICALKGDNKNLRATKIHEKTRETPSQINCSKRFFCVFAYLFATLQNHSLRITKCHSRKSKSEKLFFARER